MDQRLHRLALRESNMPRRRAEARREIKALSSHRISPCTVGLERPDRSHIETQVFGRYPVKPTVAERLWAREIRSLSTAVLR